MKVLFLLDFVPFEEDLNGATKIFHNAIKYLSLEVSIDLVVVTENSVILPRSFFQVENIYSENLEFSGPTFVGFKPYSYLSFNQIGFLDSKYDFQKYDVIHLSSLAFLDVRKFHKSVLVEMTDSVHLSINAFKSLKSFFLKFYWFIFETFFRSGHLWLSFVSKEDAEVYRSSKFKVVNTNGIDTEKYQSQVPFLDRQPNTFVFHGVLDFEPNIEAILRASTILKQIDPNIKLHLVGRFGRGNNKESLSLFNSLGNCIYLGEVESIAEKISQFRFHITLMESGSGIKNKILEALSCECVVVTNEKAIKGLVNPSELNGYIIMFSGIDSLKVKVFHENPSNLETIARNGRRYVIGNYSWERYAHNLIKYYAEIKNRNS